jgi:hypothetical protein
MFVDVRLQLLVKQLGFYSKRKSQKIKSLHVLQRVATLGRVVRLMRYDHTENAEKEEQKQHS